MSTTVIQGTEEGPERYALPEAVALATTPHPDPDAEPDRKPITVGEVWANPITGEYVRLLELPWQNRQGCAVGELIALPGARVMGEHYHPSLTEVFTPLEGELTVKLNGQIRILRQGESTVVEPGMRHEFWNATDRAVRVRVEITPGERFVHLIETLYGLARLGYTDKKGLPHPLQLALCAQEFSDVMVLSKPPRFLQFAIFGALGLIARSRGYRATYPQLSRSVMAPRTERDERIKQHSGANDDVARSECDIASDPE